MAHPELASLKGGAKAMWLRQHQREITDYWWENGTGATLGEFRIGKPDSLERLLDRAGVILWGGWEGYSGKDDPMVLLLDRPPTAPEGQKRGNRLIQHLPDAELIEWQDPYGLGLWAKHRWMQLHRDEIIEFWRGHGDAKTCAKYHCYTETLWHCLGMPCDKDGKIKWKEAIPVPGDYIIHKVDNLNAKVVEKIEWDRVILKQVRKLRRDVQIYNSLVANIIIDELDKALPGIGDLIRQELHRLPSLQQPTPADLISVSELSQALTVSLPNLLEQGGNGDH